MKTKLIHVEEEYRSALIVISWMMLIVILITKLPPKEIHPALFGAMIGAISAILIALFAPIINDRRIRHQISNKLSYVVDHKVGAGISVRVFNRSIYMMEGAVAYLVMDYGKNDVRHIDGVAQFIDSNHLTPLINDRLCWSLQIGGKNPYQLDVYPGEYQSMSVMQVVDNVSVMGAAEVEKIITNPTYIVKSFNESIIIIPSEQGYNQFGNDPYSGKRVQTGHARVALTNKDYDFILKVVSKNSYPMYGRFKYVSSDMLHPIKFLTSVDQSEFESFTETIKNKWGI